jgi:hypothetical protein
MFKLINHILTLLCYLPYLYLIGYYSYVLRAIIKLGKIPTYNNPDPKQLRFDTHREFIYELFDIIVYGLGIFVMILLIALMFKRLSVKWIHFKFLFTGIILTIWSFIDPFSEWFAD